MSRLDDLIKSLCPDGVKFRKIKEVCTDINTGLNPRKFFYVNTIDAENYYVTIREMVDGNIIFSDKTDKINDEAMMLCNNRSKLDENTVLFSGTGTIGRIVVLNEAPKNWNIKEGVYALHPIITLIVPKYLGYVLQSSKIVSKYMNYVCGGTVKSIPMRDLKNVEIPVPPLEIQKEIVHLLDDFTAKTAELQSELNKEFEARKKQYEHYEETLLNGNGATKIRLGDICHIKARIGWQGLTRKEYLHKGDYYLITGTDFSNGQVDFKNCHYVNKERYDQDANIQIQNNDVLVTKDGTLGKVAFVTGLDKPATLNAGVFVVRPTVDNINPRYLYYLLASKHLMEFAKGRVTGGTIKHLNQSIIVDFPVPLLDFENQSEIVNMLDTINALYNTLQSNISSEIESRQKQYEFYRDKLLTFKELNESEVN